MLAVDANILVYAHRREGQEHETAFELVRDLAEGSEPWAIPWPCVFEFFSIVTNRKIWRDAASTPEQASAQLAGWIASPSIRLLSETPDFWDLVHQFMTRSRVRGPVVHDARVAALCLAHGVDALVSRDRDFTLFPELTVHNPF